MRHDKRCDKTGRYVPAPPGQVGSTASKAACNPCPDSAQAIAEVLGSRVESMTAKTYRNLSRGRRKDYRGLNIDGTGKPCRASAAAYRLRVCVSVSAAPVVIRLVDRPSQTIRLIV